MSPSSLTVTVLDAKDRKVSKAKSLPCSDGDNKQIQNLISGMIKCQNENNIRGEGMIRKMGEGKALI